MIEEPSAVETTSRPDPGGTLAVGAAGTLLVLVAFTTPLTTLVSTAAGLDAGPGAQAWVLSAMPVGASAPSNEEPASNSVPARNVRRRP